MSMGHRETMKGGDEYDAFTRWRRFATWARGSLMRIKRRFNRRVRRRNRQGSHLQGDHDG